MRNQILVDVQGEDLLFKLFTSNITQRKRGDDAPFFEFIQRVCSECIGPGGCPRKVKPGCGGFGIRNFLTLLLSIEATKADTPTPNARSTYLSSSSTSRISCHDEGGDGEGENCGILPPEWEGGGGWH